MSRAAQIPTMAGKRTAVAKYNRAGAYRHTRTDDLMADLRRSCLICQRASRSGDPVSNMVMDTNIPTLDVHVGMSLSAVKRELLLQTLQLTGGNKVKAAEILGVSIKTLYNNLKEYQAEGLAGDEPPNDEEFHQD